MEHSEFLHFAGHYHSDPPPQQLYRVTTADGDSSLPVRWELARRIAERGNTFRWIAVHRPEWLPYRIVPVQPGEEIW